MAWHLSRAVSVGAALHEQPIMGGTCHKPFNWVELVLQQSHWAGPVSDGSCRWSLSSTFFPPVGAGPKHPQCVELVQRMNRQWSSRSVLLVFCPTAYLPASIPFLVFCPTTYLPASISFQRRNGQTSIAEFEEGIISSSSP